MNTAVGINAPGWLCVEAPGYSVVAKSSRETIADDAEYDLVREQKAAERERERAAREELKAEELATKRATLLEERARAKELRDQLSRKTRDERRAREAEAPVELTHEERSRRIREGLARRRAARANHPKALAISENRICPEGHVGLREAANAVGRCVSALSMACAHGQLPHIRKGIYVYVTITDAHQYIAAAILRSREARQRNIRIAFEARMMKYRQEAAPQKIQEKPWPRLIKRCRQAV